MNEKLLRSEILLQEDTLENFLKKCGMSRSAFYRKTKGKSEFTTREVKVIQKLLNLSAEKMVEIFFSSKVS